MASPPPYRFFLRRLALRTLIILLVKIIPQNFVSWLTGLLVRIRTPGMLKDVVHSLFVQAFSINLSETGKKATDYESIEEIFTRKLLPEARPLQGSPCSPADGRLIWSRAVASESEALQVKGTTMSLARLIFGPAQQPGSGFDPGWYCTVYLAPHNYHRVHSPLTGIVERIRYIPGKLWPVNNTFTRVIPGLFTENERLIFELSVEGPSAKAWLVMVGALNVGRMSSPLWPQFASNDWLKRQTRSVAKKQQIEVKKSVAAGDELGTFMLGSTVVLVFDQALSDRAGLAELSDPIAIRMGQSLPLIS